MEQAISSLLGHTKEERIRFFLKLHKQETKESYPLKYGEDNIQLPVYAIDISYPIYRIENIRTLNAHKEYLHMHPELSKDFFDDVEDVLVQQVQSDLLFSLAKEANLLQAFQKGLVPNKPLILSLDGTVLDGNRRLCVYRYLYHNFPKQYAYLKDIKIALLPDSDPWKLHELEQELQMSNSLKAKYRWYDEAYSYMMENEQEGTSYEEIAYRLRLPRKSQVLDLVESYRYAQSYLKITGHENEWYLLDHDEVSFLHLVKCRRKLSGIPEKIIYERLVFALMLRKSEKDAKGLVKNIDFVFANEELVLDELAGELQVDGLDRKALAKEITGCDLPSLSLLILSVIRNIQDAENGKENQYHALMQAKKADKILSSIITMKYGIQDTKHLSELLDNMEESIRVLRSLYRNDKSRSE